MKLLLLALALAFPLLTSAVTPAAPIRLWAGDAPGALGQADHDVPTITPFLPEGGPTSGTAIVILPGGGYGALAAHEGAGYAQWLAKQGISSFVVKYRLGSKGYRHPVMLQDAQRAIRTVRSRAAEWGIERIGLMGSSAGGHLATTALTRFDAGNATAADTVEKFSSRPDFGIVCYGVVSMEDGITHTGSRSNLLGQSPDPALIAELSNEKQVTKETPPCFVWSTGEDKVVLPENSFRFVQSLRAQGVPFDFHIYQKGGHGIGLSIGKNGVGADAVHPWGHDLLFWMRQNGWLK